MPLHPVSVVDHVLEEYRSFLLTEFRARDPKLRAALEEALGQPRFLAQDTYYQAHRPFKDGKRWDELGLDGRLAKLMRDRSGSDRCYLHQSEAIAELLGEDARPVVVTTGTGSGKTECFLLPILQNAIRDLDRHPKSGLTAIIVYPMNALANDQEARIRDYLSTSGHTSVRVERYDRTTPQSKRAEMREKPPHVLLTNYMMLEYLLVRPADRDGLFANHRCRYVVLDEVHTYRGTLGANIALLFRRLRAHLAEARQDWRADDRTDLLRFPSIVPVATSATIKSLDESDKKPEEVRALRDAAVQGFVSSLIGVEPNSIRVLGEEHRPLSVPGTARWTPRPVDVDVPASRDVESARGTLAHLAGLPNLTPLPQVVESAGILWTLQELLSSRPMGVTAVVSVIQEGVPERKGAAAEQVRREVEAAIVAGAALPPDLPGALRLRAHRFIRGGWKFERCVDPKCGRLYPMPPERCKCGLSTAPLYICRSCGAHTLRFLGAEDPSTSQLQRNDSREDDGEWLLYDMGSLELVGREDEDFEQGGKTGKQMKGREVYSGSFDPATGSFSTTPDTYSVRVALAPARNRCLVCGFSAGAGSILTPVALGTSAAVRVLSEGLTEGLAEQHRADPNPPDKERLLLFADSRQDAAHQARFITYAGRYDRMRRRLVRVLESDGGRLSYLEVSKRLVDLGLQEHDNEHTLRFKPTDIIPSPAQSKAQAWEEAPLLDDIAVSAAYRASVFNLGLVGVRYDRLDEKVERSGEALAARLSIDRRQLLHVARCILDEMRVRKAFCRPLLCYHPACANCPEEVPAADWDRRVKTPNGYSCDPDGHPIGYVDAATLPDGISLNNLWRKAKGGGSRPSIERKFRHLLDRFGSKVEPTEESLLSLIEFLTPTWIVDSKLYGYREARKLLQVNADAVELVLLRPENRRRCTVCNSRLPWAEPGSPCPSCRGVMEPWPADEVDRSRYVQRIRKRDLLPLVAGEHTAQLTGEARIELEERFKGPRTLSPVNVLACSPTLEMGIDVGGLDAVVMRNVPPRPDNYAQRGGRAGRRTRVGIVLGYARSTPHDAYFFDRPAEMIAGEVPAPCIGLGNRDVILRHLRAIAFGLNDRAQFPDSRNSVRDRKIG